MTRKYVDIILPLPLDRAFTYLIPNELEQLISRGMRVLVPFGKKFLTGVAVRFPEKTEVRSLKPVRDILDSSPLFDEAFLRLTEWLATYYYSSWGDVMKAAAPLAFSVETKAVVSLNEESSSIDISGLKTAAPRQHTILEILRSRGPSTVSALQRQTGTTHIHSILNALARKGLIRMTERLESSKGKPKTEARVSLTPAGRAATPHKAESTGGREIKLTDKQQRILETLRAAEKPDLPPMSVRDLLKSTSTSISVLRTLDRKGFVTLTHSEVNRDEEFGETEKPDRLTLTEAQQNAVTALRSAIERAGFEPYLLHGITGSGKTQVYIEAIRLALARGKTALVLVPEISLTPQIVRRFRSHFGSTIAVFHSQLSEGQRADTWRRARSGEVSIVIGPRSAVFAPLKNLGLIVVDEEHEASYKQFDAHPRYNARDVAILRASQEHAVVILGSATPSAESYHNVTIGKYKLLELPGRIDTSVLPPVRLVDMSVERKSRRSEELAQESSEKTKRSRAASPSISRPLQSAIADRIERHEGVILLQNRRGFSHVVECHDCGYVERCEQCEVTLTYHATKHHLRCHYCGYVKKPSSLCPECGGSNIRFFAFGTQQIEKELKELFPDASILRMDLDTTTRKGSHDRMLQAFARGEADVLLGTQMVAKGLDFPRVTLVGVISADTQMLLPDFRSSERTFQLMTQVAGRAGRSSLTGEVIIQTLQPNHYSLQHALTHDFKGFYREEIEYRRELDYPPFSRIVLLEFRGRREHEVQRHAEYFAERLRTSQSEGSLRILGPAPAAIARIKNQYRWHIILKNLKDIDSSGHRMRNVLDDARRHYLSSSLGASHAVSFTIDVDPVGML